MTGSVLVPHVSLFGCSGQTLRSTYQNARQVNVEPSQEKQRQPRQLQTSQAVENNASKQVQWAARCDEHVRGHVFFSVRLRVKIITNNVGRSPKIEGERAPN